MNKFIQYVKDSFKELTHNMTWISWEEAQKSTAVVAAFTVIFALMIFFADKLFQTFLKGIFNIFS